MKRITICLILSAFLPFYILAQVKPTHTNELGINFSNLNNFGIRYKHGNTTFLRLTLLSLNGFNIHSSPDSLGINKSSTGIRLNIGFEKRKSINDHLDFYSGLDLITSFNSELTDDPTDKMKFKKSSNSIGLGFVIGFSYKISNDIFISAEVVPSLVYSHDKTTNTVYGIETNLVNNGYTYGLSNSGANLTLVYRFVK